MDASEVRRREYGICRHSLAFTGLVDGPASLSIADEWGDYGFWILLIRVYLIKKLAMLKMMIPGRLWSAAAGSGRIWSARSEAPRQVANDRFHSLGDRESVSFDGVASEIASEVSRWN